MTLPLARAQGRRPITWLTLLGVLLLPVIIGGILVAALNNPVDRLGNMRAAIVNDDEPVTVNGQTVPLGRQLTAGLVKGSDDQPSNLDWSISNTDDAAKGLADGRYTAIVTIPENFSAAATSTAPGKTPEKATIQVTTAPDARLVDTAITAQIATAASSALGEQLSQVYLENVLIGYTTLGDKLGDAAAGASKLADGGASAAEGATGLQTGADALASGAGQLATGAGKLADGLGTIADGTSAAAGGAGQLASALTASADSEQAKQLAAGLQGLQQNIDGAASQTVSTAQNAGDLARNLGALAQQCVTSGGSPAFCASLGTAAQSGAAVATSAGDAATAAGTVKGYADKIIPGVQQASAALPQIGTQVQSLADGLAKLASGTRQSQSGAVALQSGATGLQSGAAQLADGAGSLSTGIAQLGTGAGDLATGLDTAVAALPSYTKQEAKDVASVVANPVTASGISTSLFGGSAIPLLAVLALWIGGLATFVALRARPTHALESRRSSPVLAARALLPAAALGALQGILVAGVAQMAMSYSWSDFSLFALLCAIAGVAFAAVHQALVAVFGGLGRWLAAIVGVLFLATNVVSTVPGMLTQIAGLLPTVPAYTALLGALTPAGGVGPAVVGLAVWAVLAFVATCLITTRQRTVSARALLSPA